MAQHSKGLSQRTLVRLIEALPTEMPTRLLTRELYESDFPEWFISHAEEYYRFDWDRIVRDIRAGTFFFPGYSSGGSNITGKYLGENDVLQLSEFLLRRLALFTAKRSSGDHVRRSLELDGYQVCPHGVDLIPLQGKAISEAKEQSLLVALIQQSHLPNADVVTKHADEAQSLFIASRDHPSLNESRNTLQALVDGISVETDRLGAHSVGLPSGTANRIHYLQQVGFLTPDEESGLDSAWAALSAGSHPGITERDEARIGLTLMVEFAQILLLKFQNWKANQYRRFS